MGQSKISDEFVGMKVVRVKDLPNLTERDIFPLPFLFCACCMGQFSANKGDYFFRHEDHVFECCDEPMSLMTKRVIFEPWGISKE